MEFDLFCCFGDISYHIAQIRLWRYATTSIARPHHGNTPSPYTSCLAFGLFRGVCNWPVTQTLWSWLNSGNSWRSWLATWRGADTPLKSTVLTGEQQLLQQDTEQPHTLHGSYVCHRWGCVAHGFPPNQHKNCGPETLVYTNQRGHGQIWRMNYKWLTCIQKCFHKRVYPMSFIILQAFRVLMLSCA